MVGSWWRCSLARRVQPRARRGGREDGRSDRGREPFTGRTRWATRASIAEPRVPVVGLLLDSMFFDRLATTKS